MIPPVGAVACRSFGQAGIRGALYAHTAGGRLPVEPAETRCTGVRSGPGRSQRSPGQRRYRRYQGVRRGIEATTLDVAGVFALTPGQAAEAGESFVARGQVVYLTEWIRAITYTAGSA